MPTVIGSLAVAAGLAGVIVAGNASGAAPAHDLFSSRPLRPGATEHARILIAPTSQPGRPYLQVNSLSNLCRVDCADAHQALSSLLAVTVTAPDGSAWQGTLAALKRRVMLPGGPVLTSSAPRPYVVSVTLPQRTGDLGEGLATTFTMQWGVVAPDGQVATRVFGESVSQHGGSPDQQPTATTLPYTGLDEVMALEASLALIGAGVSLVASARRWRRRL
jgi:hypothetical protein